MRKHIKSHKIIGGVALSLSLSVSHGALAQDNIPQGDAAEEADDNVIVVRARKKVESLQDIPLSVSVLDDEDINKRGIKDLRDAAKFTPGIIFENGFSLNDTRIVIRGLSPTRGRSNAAILVDGIDFTTEAVASAGAGQLFDQRLLDLQAIEIVKGPQSALYGRSAFAGAVQYVTRDPSGELGASLRGSIGEFGRYSISGNIDVPLGDNFGLLLNGTYWDDDSFHTDALTGGPLGGGEGFGLGAKIKIDVADNLTLKARVSYLDDEVDPQATIFFRANTVLAPPASAFTINGGPIAPGPFAVSSFFPVMSVMSVMLTAGLAASLPIRETVSLIPVASGRFSQPHFLPNGMSVSVISSCSQAIWTETAGSLSMATRMCSPMLQAIWILRAAVGKPIRAPTMKFSARKCAFQRI